MCTKLNEIAKTHLWVDGEFAAGERIVMGGIHHQGGMFHWIVQAVKLWEDRCV